MLLGAVWATLPRAIFFIAACYFYLFPLFRPRAFLVPFLAALYAALVLPTTLFAALAVGVLFFILLGIKELLFVDRATAYEIFASFLAFLLALRFFGAYRGFTAAGAVVWGTTLTAVVALVFGKLLELRDAAGERGVRLATGGIAAFLLFELLVALLILPVHPFGQAAAFAMAGAVLFGICGDRLTRKLTTQSVVSGVAALAIIFLIVWLTTTWNLSGSR